MKPVCFAFLILIAVGQSSAQMAPPTFGVEAPGFPDTSGRRAHSETSTSVEIPSPLLRYSYVVHPSGLGSQPSRLTTSQAYSASGERQIMLIFRNQTIDSATACWLDGKLLHYVDSFGSSETTPAKRVDWKLTELTNSIPPGTLPALLRKEKRALR